MLFILLSALKKPITGLSLLFRLDTLFGIICLLAANGFALRTLSGQVIDAGDKPLAGVKLSLSESGQSTYSDTKGRFEIGVEGSPIKRLLGESKRLRFESNLLFFPDDQSLSKGHIKIWIGDAKGRIHKTWNFVESTLPTQLTLFEKETQTEGVYFVGIEGARYSLLNRLLWLSAGASWQYPFISLISPNSQAGQQKMRISLGKKSSRMLVLDTLVCSLSGYDTQSLSITQDSLAGLLIRMPFAGSPFSTLQAVAVYDSIKTVTIKSRGLTVVNSGDGLYASKKMGWVADNASPIELVERQARMITLDNGLIRVTVSPSLGMRVMQMTDLSLNQDMFYEYTPIQGFRVWDVGGVEASWPFFEHGLQMLADEPESKLQSGGYRIIKESDGSVVVAMSMHFELYQTQRESALHGRYTDRSLSSWIRISPGSSKMTVHYRAENNNPTPRGKRFWNDALFKKGTDETEIILPARYAMNHFANGYADLDQFRGKTIAQWYDSTSIKKRSWFTLYPEYPFCGAYYPEEKLNRLRIFDPVRTPGLKTYIQNGLSFIEFWGGTVPLFEAPGGLVREYEPVEEWNSYYQCGDMGRISYANDYVCISVNESTKKFELSSPIAVTVQVRDFAGQTLASGPIGPGLPILIGVCEKLEIEVVTNSATVLMHQNFPLKIVDNLAKLDSVRQDALRSFNGSGDRIGVGALGTTLSSKRGFNFEAEGLQNNTDGIRDYHGLKAAEFKNLQATDSPEYLFSLAKVCYRYKRFARALELCEDLQGSIVEADADYLKGLIHWERNEIVDFGKAGVIADYHRALLAIQAGKNNEAKSWLNEYIEAYPNSFRPALLLAYLKRDRRAAQELSKQNPGSVEALYVLKLLGDSSAETDILTLMKDNFGADAELNRFKEELQGKWSHTLRWTAFPATGWGEGE